MKKTLLQLFFICFSLIVFAQEGSLDTTFNSSDVGFYFGDGTGDASSVLTIVNQSDGKILIGGNFSTYNGISRNKIARLNSDGSLDTTFNPGTGANDNIISISIQQDGKIIIAGDFTKYNEINRNRIARLNSDGSLDTTFNPSLGANTYIYSTCVQSDGNIIVGGGFTTFAGQIRNGIVRLTNTGSIDFTFNVGGAGVGSASWAYVKKIDIDSNGKIIIAGGFSSYNGNNRGNIARLNNDGSLDLSFNSSVGSNQSIETFSVQSDNKIIIGGNFNSYNGDLKNKIARINSDGSTDLTFVPSIGVITVINALSIQADGKIIFSGQRVIAPGKVKGEFKRLNSDGSLDNSFNTGTGIEGIISSLFVKSDGKIIIGGGFSRYNDVGRYGLTQLHSDGILDMSFNLGTSANDKVFTTCVQNDGKIILGGSFKSYNGIARPGIARLNTDGSLDASFSPDLGKYGNVFATAVQSDGKVLYGGSLVDRNQDIEKSVIRLNADGSTDNTFILDNAILPYMVQNIIVQPDGKILLYSSSGLNFKIFRLNQNGSLDNTFTIGTANSGISNVLLQPDGKIIIVGSFYTYNTITAMGIARLNTDGSIDSTFNTGTGVGNIGTGIYASALQPDGKILIGGLFTFYNNQSCGNIARLNSDGSLDSTFTPSLQNIITVYKLMALADGKVIVGGLGYYGGTDKPNITKLNADGSLDNSFDAGLGIRGFMIETISVQNDGKIIIGGDFKSYNNVGRNRVARLNNTFLNVNSNSIDNIQVFVFKKQEALCLKTTGRLMKSVFVYDVFGKKIYENLVINSSNLKIHNLKSDNQVLILKIIDVDDKIINKKILF